MSGTPLTNRPIELWPALNILRPDKYGSFFEFANRYTIPQWTLWGWKYTGATRLDELHRILKKRCMIRRRKADVLSQLPSKTRTVVPVTLNKKALKEYQEVEFDFIKWLRKTHPHRSTVGRSGDRMAKMGYLKRLAGRLKLQETINWIESFLEENEGKLIVFGVHRQILQALRDRFSKICVHVDGSVIGKERQERFDKFAKHTEIRILFGNIHAAGVGWNGTCANTVLFAELDWVPGNHVQAEDRIHRIGQTRGASVYYLVARNTIEEMLIKVLQTKQNVLDETLDGKKGSSGMNVLDQLEKIMLEAMKSKSFDLVRPSKR